MASTSSPLLVPGDFVCSVTASAVSLTYNTNAFRGWLIAYTGSLAAPPYFNLRVARCQDVECSLAGFTTLYAWGGRHATIATGPDGLGLIAHDMDTNLVMSHCDDAQCLSATSTIIESVPDSHAGLALTIGSDGLGIVAYGLTASKTLSLAHCTNLTCTNATSAVIDAAGGFTGGLFNGIAIGSDGMPLVSYMATSSNQVSVLRVAHLANVLGLPYYRRR